MKGLDIFNIHHRKLSDLKIKFHEYQGLKPTKNREISTLYIKMIINFYFKIDQSILS
jgi:hypothetical protein